MEEDQAVASAVTQDAQQQASPPPQQQQQQPSAVKAPLPPASYDYDDDETQPLPASFDYTGPYARRDQATSSDATLAGGSSVQPKGAAEQQQQQQLDVPLPALSASARSDDAYSLATPSRSMLTPSLAVPQQQQQQAQNEDVEMDEDATQVLPPQATFEPKLTPSQAHWSSLCTPPVEPSTPASPRSAPGDMAMSEDELDLLHSQPAAVVPRSAASSPGPSHFPGALELHKEQLAPVSSAPIEPSKKRTRSPSPVNEAVAPAPPAFSPSPPPPPLSTQGSIHEVAAAPPGTLRFSSPALEEEEEQPFPASGLAPIQQRPRSRSLSASRQTASPRPADTAAVQPMDLDADAAAAAQVAAMPPSPPRRNLRARKPDQLNPYTIEGMRYRRRLERNDWQDAVVSQREVLRRSKAEREEERKRQRRERGQPSDESSDEESRAAREKEKLERRAAREQKQREREEAQKRRREREAIQQAKAAEKMRAAPDASALFALYGGELTDSQEDEFDALPRPSPPPRPKPRPRAQGVTTTYARRDRQPSTSNANEAAAASPSSSSDTGPVRKRIRRANGTASGDDNAPSIVSISSDDQSASSNGRSRSRRQSRRSSSRPMPPLDDDGNESDDTYYAQQFKLLRRVMPFHMARKHIEDLKAMHRGKAYHSDGHVSATPDPPERGGSGSASEGEPAAAADTSFNRSTPATTPQTSPHGLAPGEARRRMAPRTEGDEARFEIIGDPLSEDDDPPSPVTLSESCEDERPGASVDADIRWWAAPVDKERPFESRRRKVVDDIDRLLQRAGTSAGNATRKRAKGTTMTRRAGKSGAPRRNGAAAQSRPAGHSAWRGPEAPRNAQKHKAPAPAPRFASARRPGKPNRLENPPIVVPRVLKRLDLIDDRVLFDFELPNDLRILDGAAVPDASTAAQRGGLQTPGAYSSVMQTPGAAVHSSGLRSSLNETPSRPGASSMHSIDLRSPSPVARAPAPHLQQSRLQAQAQAQARQPLSPLLPQRQYQARIDSLLPGKAAPAAVLPVGIPEHLQVQQHEAQEWSDFGSLTLDFGIAPLPPGICFEGNSYLGRGRLFELLTMSRADAQFVEARDTQFMGVELRTDWSSHRMIEELPAIFDAVFAAVQEAAKGEPAPRNALDDALRFLCLSLSAIRRLAGAYEATRVQRRVMTELARVHTRLAAAGVRLANASHGVGALLLSLHWFKVELCWRCIGGAEDEEAPPSTGFASIDGEADENLCHASRELMLALLVHGLHRTMKSVKVAARSDDDGLGVTIIRDLSAELWICLIHLLSHATTTTHFGAQAAFWPSFEAAYTHFQQVVPTRRALLVSETAWYATLSMCALSQFSAATGTVTSKPHLQQHWPLVLRALSAIRLRYDDQIERAMPSAAISKRDHYMRAVVQRCLNLASIWQWSFDGADALLTKLFHLFESHRLANLPCEQDHDFAPFLREYDEALLYDASKRESTAFHVFVKLLAQASADFRSSAEDAKEGDKRVSRLLSRMMPMRVMPFSRAAPPTALERSMLFNHYSLAMLFLHLVPSAAAQRLRQIKSFLVFQGADVASQITCIRAMVYAAVIYRQHGLDVTPIVSWFSGAFKSLLQEFAELEAKSSRASKDKLHDSAHQASLRQQRRVASLLVAALRSVQHIIEHRGLRKSAANDTPSYPNVALLDKAWTSEILETQLAVDPSVGHEALKIIHAFLIQRNEAVAALMPRRAADTVAAQTAVDEDSQDSFADFDDLDAVFAAVDAAEAAQQAPQAAAAASVEEISNDGTASVHAKDLAFAEVSRTTIVPSLFRLISNIFHPDHVSTGRNVSLGLRAEPLNAAAATGRANHRAHLDEVLKQASRRCYVELLIDCWAGCANVLVRNGLRDWDSFLTLGNESWKRIDDAIAKRDVGLRFLQNMISLDATSYESNASELLSMWFSAAPARALSIQHIYTRTLSDLEPTHPWFRDCPWPRDETGKLRAISLEAFEQNRLVAIQSILPAMRQDYEAATRTPEAVRRRQATFACLSALLSSLRIYAEEPGALQPSRKAEQVEYLDFASSICAAMRADLGATILRGVDAELRRTSALIERLRAAAAAPVAAPQLVGF